MGFLSGIFVNMELEKYYYFLDDTEMGIAFGVLYYILCDKEISTWGLGGYCHHRGLLFAIL
jgi:hypothetical protein